MVSYCARFEYYKSIRFTVTYSVDKQTYRLFSLYSQLCSVGDEGSKTIVLLVASGQFASRFTRSETLVMLGANCTVPLCHVIGCLVMVISHSKSNETTRIILQYSP